ncbi:hypothetical protein EVAR_47930_1 [Eumeta japonica]|uniref:Uncharacterized protein n=1 Tax=Eumeta variegata TaxID=151549 RepID=A0A4C1Y7L7_EUMVA|nr:hypothetical protein EVAR_47930_1 [Eumeta japonica]
MYNFKNFSYSQCAPKGVYILKIPYTFDQWLPLPQRSQSMPIHTDNESRRPVTAATHRAVYDYIQPLTAASRAETSNTIPFRRVDYNLITRAAVGDVT